jgi:hypothetical protein
MGPATHCEFATVVPGRPSASLLGVFLSYSIYGTNYMTAGVLPGMRIEYP